MLNTIVAVDSNWGIGYMGTQQIVIPADRKHFREVTDGGAVIVGRKTLEDFPGGKPLKNRLNIVLTSNPRLHIEGAAAVNTLSELFSLLENLDQDKVFVIGGDSVYKQLLPYCKYAYLTKIKASPPADRFFPNLDEDPNWIKGYEEAGKTDDGIEYSFVRYENKAPLPIK